MKIDKTHWNTDEYKVSPAATFDDDREQPSFGVKILWNTLNILKPVLVVHFWHWRIQIGWLVE